MLGLGIRSGRGGCSGWGFFWALLMIVLVVMAGRFRFLAMHFMAGSQSELGLLV